MRRVLAAILLLLAGPALAGNGMSAIPTVQVERQSNSIAVKAIVGGDNDSSAVLRIFQRWQFAPSFDTGMVMIRRPHGSGLSAGQSAEIFEGRIIPPSLPCGLPQVNRIIEWYIEATDAGGKFDYKSSATPDTASLQPVRQLVASGPVFYVSQGTGDDLNDGSRSHPFRTISAGVAALSASANHGKNGGIFVAPGEYHERITLNSTGFPTDGDQHFLEGDGTNRDSTIICGANQWVERGMYAPGHPLHWVNTGQDSTWKCYFPRTVSGSSPGDSTQLIVLGWNEWIHRKTSMLGILNDSTYAGVAGSTNSGELSGWFIQNDTLYLKRHSGRSPSGLMLHTGYLDNLIWVQRRNWRIANLSFRFAGGRENSAGVYPAAANPGENGRAIVAGVDNGGSASGLVVDSCKVYGLNAEAIYSPRWAGSVQSDTVVIANSTVDGLSIGAMSYGAARGRIEQNACRIALTSRAASVFNCSLTGTFGGVRLPAASAADSTGGSQGEIFGNTMTHMVDDAVELDNSHAINTLVAGNSMLDPGRGLSQTPCFTGPILAFFNQILDAKVAGISAAGGTSARTLYAHNTIVSQVTGASAVDATAGGTVDGLTFVDNVLYSNGGIPVNGPIDGSFITNTFNFNWVGGNGNTTHYQWQGITMDTVVFTQIFSGWEKNGAESPLGAVDTTARNLLLRPSSPAFNLGRRLSGINTSLDGARYFGAAPDMGAIERKIQ